ncbi:GHKL domain-containing protein [Anaerotignum faecicola]
MSVNVTAEDFSRFQPTDLCSLISNALENAVHGCEKTENGYIKVKIYEKNKKLCINIANSLCENIVFENHMPVAKNAGHGIGVKSMASVVEKYGGVYGFFADGNEFRFQVSM